MITKKETIIRLLTALFPDSTIYLFGSYARGTQQESSDVDLAVDAKRKLSLREISEARNIISSLNVPQKIDIVDLHSVSDLMKKNILKEGIVWKD